MPDVKRPCTLLKYTQQCNVKINTLKSYSLALVKSNGFHHWANCKTFFL